MTKELIRNFSIIAHIDHGKSTLADRILEHTHAIEKREFRDQLLDDMDLERERGITIKASAVRLQYNAKDGKNYILNLIDTPGHVDFTYEVTKSIAACEGALLVVDASQGVEAQTVANLYLALQHNLAIIPVINKIDLSNAEVDKTKEQIVNILNLKGEDIILASAKENIGVDEVLETIVKRISPPPGEPQAPLQALIFDSKFDVYKGVIIYIRVMNGTVRVHQQIQMMSNNKTYQVQEIGVCTPHLVSVEQLSCGEVGYITCNIRDAKDIINGDTVTDANSPAKNPLPGYKKITPMVYSGVYPSNAKDFFLLKEALEKLSLSDASFVYEPESSASLGFGFRCGFLGLLHMEIIQERLEREYDLDLVITTPSVIYRIKKNDGKIVEVDNPSKLPPPQQIDYIEEPFVKIYIIIPADTIGDIMELCTVRRGVYKSTEYLSIDKAQLIYEMPLSEVIVDFYDKIKSMTRGYGSIDYEFISYVNSEVVKLDILINGKVCDAFSSLIYKEKALPKGRLLVSKLKELIPRQLFEVIIQAAIGSNIIARETVRPVGKHVTAKCYGGDITRKRKLWAKQKEGKRRMKQFGQVQIPQEAFLAVLKTN